MAKTPTGELFSTLKSYFHQLTEGERTPTEVAAALNDWAREGAESVKAKIGEEVEATVSRMGFVKREEYEELLHRITELESRLPQRKVTSRAPGVKKSAAKKKSSQSTTKKSQGTKASK